MLNKFKDRVSQKQAIDISRKKLLKDNAINLHGCCRWFEPMNQQQWKNCCRSDCQDKVWVNWYRFG